jgi:hypothetical protein
MARLPGTSGADGREAWEMVEHGDLAMAAGSIGGEGEERRAEAGTVLKRGCRERREAAMRTRWHSGNVGRRFAAELWKPQRILPIILWILFHINF